LAPLTTSLKSTGGVLIILDIVRIVKNIMGNLKFNDDIVED